MMECTYTNKVYRSVWSVGLLLGLFVLLPASGFVNPQSRCENPVLIQKTLGRRAFQSQSTVCLSSMIDSSSVLVAAESWRQYVPLVVSVGIIIDILLGSPLANAVLKPMRPDDGEGEGDDKADKPVSKARIDAELVAQQALDKANNALELKQFLEERKTDYDRMEEMKKKLDATMQDLDEDLDARQKSLDARKNL